MEALGEGSTLSHYLLQSKLGQGGMGVVYLATDTRLHRPVALKVLAPGRLHDEDSRRRLVQEARTASGLNHPHIVTIYDIGAADGRDFVAMEYLEGKTLDDHIAGKPMPPSRVVRYALQIADALAAAHDAGVVHRDLKPGNVMITRRDHVKLLDFGLAKVREAARPEGVEDSETITAGPLSVAGVLLGTIAYMSPEQVEGRLIGPHTDMFAFGVLLYEMLTGRRPFSGISQVATLAAMLYTEPAPIRSLAPDAPPELEDLVAHCLRKKAEDRPAKMSEVMQRLTEIQEKISLHSAIQATGALTAALPQAPSPSIGTPAPAGAAGKGLKVVWAPAFALAAVVVWLGWMAWKKEDIPTPPSEPVLTRVTFDGSFAGFPALSADGRLVAYVSDRGEQGNLDIWVQQNEPGAAPIRITSDETDESEPAFSPDSSRIAFRSERENGAVFLAPALGGNATLVARGGRRPRFSPDGKWIAYWEGSMGSGFVPGSGRIKIVPAAGGTPRPIQPQFAVAAYPVWLPDGSGLVFLGQPGTDPKQRDWWTTPVDGGEARPTGVLAAIKAKKLAAPPGGFEIFPEAFYTGRILFSARLGDGVHVWDVGLPRGSEPLAEPRRLTSGTKHEVHPSAAGQTLIFASTEVSTQIWKIPLRRGEPAGEPVKITGGAAFDAFPSVSDNGRRMAFVSDRSGRRGVWVRDLATNRESRLTGSSEVELQPKINAPGDTIVYYEDRGRRLFAARLQPGGRFGTPELICESCGIPSDVTADGRKALLEPGGAPHLPVLLDLVTRERRTLASWDGSGGYVFAPSFSHDEKWIAFHATLTGAPAGTRKVFVIPLRSDGRQVEFKDWIPVTDGSTMDREVVWSADDSALYFLSERDGFRCIWSQKLDPVSRRPVGPAAAVQHFHRLYRSLGSVQGVVAAIGLTALRDQLVFSLGETAGEVWLQR